MQNHCYTLTGENCIILSVVTWYNIELVSLMSQSLQKAKITNSTILKAHNATDFGIQPSSNSPVANIVIINC